MNILVLPLVCSVTMGACAWGVYGIGERFFHGRFGVLLSMGIAILAAVVVYLILTVLLRMITKEDMRLIPGGDKIAKLLHMK